eukprot:1495152-Prymnesium_polylepis.1
MITRCCGGAVRSCGAVVRCGGAVLVRWCRGAAAVVRWCGVRLGSHRARVLAVLARHASASAAPRAPSRPSHAPACRAAESRGPAACPAACQT